jgi:hypothetical protein
MSTDLAFLKEVPMRDLSSYKRDESARVKFFRVVSLWAFLAMLIIGVSALV